MKEGYDMEKRRIGNSELYASVIGFGCWIASGSDYWAGTEEKEIIKTMQAAYERGINFFDVAPVYGYGNAEKVLGRAVKGFRHEIIIASKCGLVWEEVRHERPCLAKESILAEIDRTLKRLDMDHVDLYQLHWPDYDVPIEETMEAINMIVKSGKVRYVGLSNFPIGLAKTALKYTPIVSEQLLYNMLDRNSSHYHNIPLHYRTHDQMVEFCRNHSIAIIPYSPLSQGLLTGKYKPEKVSAAGIHDVRNANPELQGDSLARRMAVVSKLITVADEIEKPLNEVALNWLLAEPAVATIVCGARNIEQVAGNINATTWKLDKETYQRLNTILDEEGF